jgi:topoisomerase-4 subunit A
MRYTESRLTRYAEVLLGELGSGTVDWAPNFDGTIEEPVIPAGAAAEPAAERHQGIAVGMATDIPPHNLREVAQRLRPSAGGTGGDHAQLMKHIKGPDLPTGAEIISPRDDLLKASTTPESAASRPAPPT